MRMEQLGKVRLLSTKIPPQQSKHDDITSFSLFAQELSIFAIKGIHFVYPNGELLQKLSWLVGWSVSLSAFPTLVSGNFNLSDCLADSPHKYSRRNGRLLTSS
jgi:hypothetical protein